MFYYDMYKDKYKTKVRIKAEEETKKAETEIRKKYVQIYKGRLYKKNSPLQLIYQDRASKPEKIVVFDLDETLGSFGDMDALWSGFVEYIKLNQNNPVIMPEPAINTNDIVVLLDDPSKEPGKLNQEWFNKLLAIYPEFLRTGILDILRFLLRKKNAGECFKMYIYTNNQCSSYWTHSISNYISKQLNQENVFDQVVCAFKIRNQIVEPKRTTHDKTFQDFIQCSMMPKNVELCFIDNTYFSKMRHEKVYYIQPRGYYHGLSYLTMIDRLVKSGDFKEFTERDGFLLFIQNWFRTKGSASFSHVKSKQEYAIDGIVFEKMMFHIKEFFYMNTRNVKTRKWRSPLGRFTRKKR